MTDIIAQDCRLEGYSANRVFRVYKAIHHPTNLLIEFANGLTKREAMNRLQTAVNEREATVVSSKTQGAV